MYETGNFATIFDISIRVPISDVKIMQLWLSTHKRSPYYECLFLQATESSCIELNLSPANRLCISSTGSILPLLEPDWLLILPQVKLSDHLPNRSKKTSANRRYRKSWILMCHSFTPPNIKLIAFVFVNNSRLDATGKVPPQWSHCISVAPSTLVLNEASWPGGIYSVIPMYSLAELCIWILFGFDAPAPPIPEIWSSSKGGLRICSQ